MSGPTTRVPQPPQRVSALEGAGLSHAGCVRRNNEDAILTDPAGALWAVADGMGGHGHGDIAADIVIQHLTRLLSREAADVHLVNAIDAANTEIRHRGAADGLGQMGATVVTALIVDGRATIAWVGDSRAYRLRNGELMLLTHDHSVVQELLDGGCITPAEAEQHPEAHVVTRAVGATDQVNVALTDVALVPGDVLILCSDGLTKCVPEPEIAALTHAELSSKMACRRLIDAAVARGAPDNVSVIVVRTNGVVAR